DAMRADSSVYPDLVSLSFCGGDSATMEVELRKALNTDALLSSTCSTVLAALVRKLGMTSGSVGPTEFIVAKTKTIERLRQAYLDRTKLLHCYHPAGGTQEPWTFLYPPHLRTQTALAIASSTAGS